MTQLVLVLLAVIWLVVLAPDVARLIRPGRRATSSVDRFRQQLDSLGRSAPAAVQISQEQKQKRRRSGGPQPRWTSPSTSMPTTPQQAAVRRRDIGTLLVPCTLVTLAGALTSGSIWALAAAVVLVVMSSAFAILVVRRHRAAPTAEVHYLPLRDADTASTVKMIRRTANE